jgi:hypothetical protein
MACEQKWRRFSARAVKPTGEFLDDARILTALLARSLHELTVPQCCNNLDLGSI